MRKLLTLFSLLIFSGVGVFAQSKTISGTVTDENAIPLPDVSVLVQGTKLGTSTDSDGSFHLTVPPEAKTLLFSSTSRIV